MGGVVISHRQRWQKDHDSCEETLVYLRPLSYTPDIFPSPLSCPVHHIYISRIKKKL
jgi:hypothetical protein